MATTRLPQTRLVTATLAATVAITLAIPARADIAVSANDAHTVLDHGNQVASTAKPDTLTVIDLSAAPRIVATIDVPASVVGPPTAIWIAPDETWAIATAATKLEPPSTNATAPSTSPPSGTPPTGTPPSGTPQITIGPDDRVSVIDLTTTPPKLVQSLPAGAGATTVRVTPDGAVALVANRTEGTISVFTIKDRRLTDTGKTQIDPKSLPSGLAILPDGKTALLSRYGDNQVSILHLDGTTITIDKRPLTTALAPYTLDISPDGTLAAVSNMGRGDGDIDSVSLIDLTATPIRVVQTLDVCRSPEGLKWSPDGKFLAVGCQNGTTKSPDSLLYQASGRLIMLALDDHRLHQIAEAPIGQWTQGIAFARDGKTLLVQDMVAKRLQIFGWNGTALTATGDLPLSGGAAAIATSWQ